MRSERRGRRKTFFPGKLWLTAAGKGSIPNFDLLHPARKWATSTAFRSLFRSKMMNL